MDSRFQLTPAEYHALLRLDFYAFIERCFLQLNPNTKFMPNWHIEVMAAKLEACRQGKIRRLIINVPPPPPQIAVRLHSIAGLVLGPQPLSADFMRQLRAGPLGQVVARLSQRDGEQLVQGHLRHPSLHPAAIGAGVQNQG